MNESQDRVFREKICHVMGCLYQNKLSESAEDHSMRGVKHNAVSYIYCSSTACEGG